MIGRREDRLSSEVLLSWRARALVSLMLSASSRREPLGCPVREVGAGGKEAEGASSRMGSVVKPGDFIGLRTVVGTGRTGVVDMAFRR